MRMANINGKCDRCGRGPGIDDISMCVPFAVGCAFGLLHHRQHNHRFWSNFHTRPIDTKRAPALHALGTTAWICRRMPTKCVSAIGGKRAEQINANKLPDATTRHDPNQRNTCVVHYYCIMHWHWHWLNKPRARNTSKSNNIKRQKQQIVNQSCAISEITTLPHVRHWVGHIQQIIVLCGMFRCRRAMFVTKRGLCPADGLQSSFVRISDDDCVISFHTCTVSLLGITFFLIYRQLLRSCISSIHYAENPFCRLTTKKTPLPLT